MTPPSIDAIRAALDCIPPDLPRDEWARVAMALKSELWANPGSICSMHGAPAAES